MTTSNKHLHHRVCKRIEESYFPKVVSFDPDRVGGAESGFEPLIFGLLAQRATRLLYSADLSFDLDKVGKSTGVEPVTHRLEADCSTS